MTEEDWEQQRMLWKIFEENGDDKAFVHNLSGHVSKALPEIQRDTISRYHRLSLLLRLLIHNNRDVEERGTGN